MASISSIAQSGLQAAQQRLGASAHNVANMNTPGFRRESVAQEAAPGNAGVATTGVQRAGTEGGALEREAVEQLSATYAFAANLKTLSTQDRMLGTLLDTRA